MINIFTVISELENENWTLISTEYKNLKEPLEMRCPNGHTQFISFEKWRRTKRCDACLTDSKARVRKNNVPLKENETYRILALDAATRITGFSVYDNGSLVSYGTFKAKQSFDSTSRINEIKHLVIAAIEEWKPDFIEMEQIQLQTYGKNNSLQQVETYRVLANLQGVLCDVFFENNIEYDLVTSSAWRKYCGVEGYVRENKKLEAQRKVKQWYNVDCTDDEADAICIGKYAVRPTKQKITFWGEE